MSLKSNIQQFGLTGKNVAHYNLPASQQAALEKYIGLEGYPTYKLIDPKWQNSTRPLPATEPTRYGKNGNRAVAKVAVG